MMAVLAVPAIGIVWIWRKLRGSPESGRNDDSTKKFLERLRSPDFAVIEKHFGVALPPSIKDFYMSDLVTKECDFSTKGKDWSISFFEPIDENSLRESWPGYESLVSIANDGCGNEYVFDPTSDSKAVRFHDHETGEFNEVTRTLDEFLAEVRTAIGNPQSEQ